MPNNALQIARAEIERLIQQGTASVSELQHLLTLIPSYATAAIAEVQRLIGQGGANLAELQALLALMPSQAPPGGGGHGEEDL